MAKTKNVKTREGFSDAYSKRIEPGTPAMESLLSAGYSQFGIETAEDAKAIIADWDKNQNIARVPREQLKAAKAFLSALNAKPVAIDTHDGHWDADEVVEQ